MAEAVAPTPAAPAPNAPADAQAPADNTGAELAAKTKLKGGGAGKQVDELQRVERAKAADAAKAAVEAPTKRKYKQKVDGEEFEEELTDDEVIARLQKEKAWNKRQNELAKERRKLQDFYERNKKDPLSIVKEMYGVDPLELAQARLAEQYKKQFELQQLKPEDRIKAEYEEKLAAEQQKLKDMQAQIEAKEQEALEAKVLEETKSDFTAALESEGLPASWKALHEMAVVAKMALDNGLRLTSQQLAMEVRNRLESRDADLHKEVLGGLEGEALLKRFDPAVVKKIVQAVLAQQKASVKVPPAAPVKRDKPAATVIPAELKESQKRKMRLGIL